MPVPANLKPGMIVSVRDPWTFYPRCLVVTDSRPVGLRHCRGSGCLTH